MASLVVTVVGEDRPGLVGQISDVVRRHSGNWLESRMSHLGDQFAGIILVEVDDENLKALRDELAHLEDDGLLVAIKGTGTDSSQGAEGRVYSLSVVGNDRPGIVREVTQVLASHKVNVEELNTNCGPAPHTGGSVFRAEATVRVPSDLSVDTLQQELEQLAADLMIDLNAG